MIGPRLLRDGAWLAVVAVLIVSGCGASLAPDAGIDAGVGDDVSDVGRSSTSDGGGGDVSRTDVATDVPADVPMDLPSGARLELGEGATSFRPIEDADTLLLARGCQGSQHVWITLRVFELAPGAMTVRLELLRASDELLVSADYSVRAAFVSDPAGFEERRGIALEVPIPDPYLASELLLRGTVVDADGTMVFAERRVSITWGTEVCTP